MMMIHKPWVIAGGDAEEMRSHAELLDKVESVMIPAYTDKTGKSAEEIAAMLAEETWMSGKECVEQGFADKTISPIRAMACIQSKRIEEFEKMPESIKNMIIPPQANAGHQPQVPAPQADGHLSAPDFAAIRAEEREAQKKRVAEIGRAHV